ncbi:MAG: FHA domain-containing protein [Leptolyngbyaceae cyanobacterium RU_5_1]|nr:FHA domain-containing protein [Leptolyngbyaceae cyanobacterium RU_5_1]
MIKIKIIHNQTGESREQKLTSEMLSQGRGLIGRHPNCDLVLNSSDVSRVHARIICQEGQYYFSDLGSTSGSIFNDETAQTNQNFFLKSNDMIRVGDFILLVKEVDAKAARAGKSAVNLGQIAAVLVIVPVLVVLVVLATTHASLAVDGTALEKLLDNGINFFSHLNQ